MNLNFSCIFIVCVFGKKMQAVFAVILKFWDSFCFWRVNTGKNLVKCCLVRFFFSCIFHMQKGFLSLRGSPDAFSIAEFRQNICYSGFSKLLSFPGLCKDLPVLTKLLFQHFSSGMQCIISPSGSKESGQYSEVSQRYFMQQPKSSRTICVWPIDSAEFKVSFKTTYNYCLFWAQWFSKAM